LELMRNIMIGMIAMGLAVQAVAASRAELDERIVNLTARFDQMQRNPDKAVPASLMEKAQAIVLVHRVKAGFVFAFEGGTGVAMVKDPKTQQWGAPAFVKANHGSLGPQVGGESSFYAIVLMNTNDLLSVTSNDAELGAEAGATGGDESASAASTTAHWRDRVLVFDDRRGFFAGASVSIGAFSEWESANLNYYGEALTVREIAFEHKGKPTETAVALARKLKDYSKAPVLSQSRKNY
jgi:lipid-binding SYLF domain-containing protein